MRAYAKTILSRTISAWWSAKAGVRALFVLFCFALPIAIAFAPRANAQAPVHRTLDERGVDLSRGTFNMTRTELAIGQGGAGGLAFVRSWIGSSWTYNYIGTLGNTDDRYNVYIGELSETFTLDGGVYIQNEGRGSTLSYDSGSDTYSYTSASGTVVVFDPDIAITGNANSNRGQIVSLTRPNGERLTFHYNGLNLQSVTNNFGYQLHFEYTSGVITKVTAINNAIDYCSPTASSCGLSGWPTVTFARSGSYETVTDSLGGQTRFTYDGSGRIAAIRRPSSNSADHIAISYHSSGAHSGRVSSMSDGTGTWSYAYSDSGGNRTTTITDPASNTRVVVSPTANGGGRMTSDTDGAGRTTTYTYDASGRLERVTRPEGNYVEYSFGVRGNITSTVAVAKSGSGLTFLETQATYPSTCSNPATCNQPTSTTDSRGFTTDYTYDSTHGGVLTITAPDPDGGGSLVRPQTRFAYDDFSAWYKQPSSTSTPAQAPTAIYLPTEVSACATSTWGNGNCGAGTGADETRTVIAYQGSTTGGNNLRAVSTTVRSGESSPLTATSALSYDNVGNVISVDGPLAGSDDTVRTFYDLNGQVTGTIGPDPDGGGSLRYPASRVSYNADGQPTVSEVGSVTSTDLSVAPASWSTFQTLQKDTTTYNFRGEPIRVTAEGRAVYTDSWSTSGVVQQSYYANGLPECTTLRMNSADFGGGTAACTQGTGSADRITRTTYTNADEISTVTQGYGTAAAITEQTLTYTNNSLVSTITDAGSNRTTNIYDGHDRLVEVRYPHPSSANTSNSSDNELYTYSNANDSTKGLLTSQTRRDDASVALAYDNLGRLTGLDAPGSTLDIARTYDNFSRTLTIAANSQTLTYSYDQLSRLVSEAQPRGTISYQYDAAGRRTRATWPDSFYVDYIYDVAGAVTQIRENGATSGIGVLATYAYDNLGRRTSLTRGNGTTENYSYDTESRLSSLANDLASSSYDQSVSFTYNEASEIISRANTNTSYQWSPLSAATTSYTDNGLNQYTAVGGATPTYDTRGNLTSDGTRSFSYDIYNRLITGPSSAALSYDPGGRLYEYTANPGGGAVTTRFLYDGAALVAEFNTANTLLRRYVHGPGMDEPIVWYERNGGGTYDRKWLVADERGSITAVANDSGAVTDVYTYDEFGNPNSWSGARFRYTGQVMLAEAQLYHYKARVYDPRVGRFLQTDPIGFAGGMNLYGYTSNNPVNGVDPWGLSEEDVGEVVVTGRPKPRRNDNDPYAELTPIPSSGAIRVIGVLSSGRKQARHLNLVPIPADDVGTTVEQEGEVIFVTAQRRPQLLTLTSGSFRGIRGGARIGAHQLDPRKPDLAICAQLDAQARAFALEAYQNETFAQVALALGVSAGFAASAAGAPPLGLTLGFVGVASYLVARDLARVNLERSGNARAAASAAGCPSQMGVS